MSNRQFEFRFEPVGSVMLPSIRDWDLYQRVITFTFYRLEGDELRSDGVYAHVDELEDTRKVLKSFYKRMEGNYSVSRMKLLWDYFVNIMNSGPGSLNMGRFFLLDGVIQLKDYERHQVDFNGCIVACWRRYISALRKEDVRSMALFFRRIIMPQVDIVFYNLSILNENQTVVYRTDQGSSESLEVNPDEEWEHDIYPTENDYHRNATIGEAQAVKVDKGKGKCKQVVVDSKRSMMVSKSRSVGFGPGSRESMKNQSIPTFRGVYLEKNGESSKDGAARGRGRENIQPIDVIPAYSQEFHGQTPREMNPTDADMDERQQLLPEMGSVAQDRTTSFAAAARRGGSTYLLKSTVRNCKKQVAQIKNRLARVTSRRFKTNTSEGLSIASMK
ncbi:hypothetical protein TWF730_004557 [Orbilia blumenaviensis]|uniref:Uncharacterized protein n=1 Tax=Orbilia blumenaviensis TaxID=1796055 RepID=A0AAV9TYT2_9PEZI